MINKAKNMIEDLLNKKYNPLEFSYDFPEFMLENYDALEKENKEINKILNDEIPEICADYEIGENPDSFLNRIKLEYERVLKNMDTKKVFCPLTQRELDEYSCYLISEAAEGMLPKNEMPNNQPFDKESGICKKCKYHDVE